MAAHKSNENFKKILLQKYANKFGMQMTVQLLACCQIYKSGGMS